MGPEDALIGARILLRPFQADDVKVLAAIHADPEVMRYSPTGPMSGTQVSDWLHDIMGEYDRVGYSYYGVVLRDDMRLIGMCGLQRGAINRLKCVQLGYRIAKPYWGRGLATEAVIIALSCAFETLGISDVVAIVQPENEMSARVLQKVGMTCKGRTVYMGVSHSIYSISKNEWLAPV